MFLLVGILIRLAITFSLKSFDEFLCLNFISNSFKFSVLLQSELILGYFLDKLTDILIFLNDIEVLNFTDAD